MTGSGSSCGACKFLRRKCTCDCVFAPYFSYDQASTHFAAVHKVFGASNVSKLLLHLPAQARSDASVTISYEALARMRDPVYGCVAHIFALQEQVANLQEEIEILGNQMVNLGVGFQSSRDDQFHDNNNIINDVRLQHFSETNDHNHKSVMFCQNTAEHPLLFQTQSEASNMMMSTEFDGMCGWEMGQDQDRDQDQSGENDPNLMDKIFEETETGTCTTSYPWIMNNV